MLHQRMHHPDFQCFYDQLEGAFASVDRSCLAAHSGFELTARSPILYVVKTSTGFSRLHRPESNPHSYSVVEGSDFDERMKFGTDAQWYVLDRLGYPIERSSMSHDILGLATFEPLGFKYSLEGSGCKTPIALATVGVDVS